MSDFDHRVISAAIQSQRDKLLPRVHGAVRDSLSSLEPAEALTLRLLQGEKQIRVLRPAASAEYAGALIAFCRSKDYSGYAVDSGVTPQVVTAVENCLLDFYTSDAVGNAVADAVIKEMQEKGAVATTVREELAENRDWLQHELSILNNLDAGTSIAVQLSDAAAHQMHHFFQTAVGKQIILIIGKIMATSTGKMLVIKTVQIAVAKVMASAALKAALLTTIKKVGVGLLIKTAIGKALLALLAVVGLAHVPLVWIILPVLAAFLAYEYHHFPGKLSAQVPDEVVRVIDAKFGELNDTIARNILDALLKEMVSQLTTVRTGETPS